MMLLSDAESNLMVATSLSLHEPLFPFQVVHEEIHVALTSTMIIQYSLCDEI